MFTKRAPISRGFVNPLCIEQTWPDRVDGAMDSGVFAFTILPDMAGRLQVLLILVRLITCTSKHLGVKWAPFEDTARDGWARVPLARAARPDVT